ncbi:MAG: rhomboid family intramembrane serine protease [Flavobacteriales bacterium]|nr:rhomboid family intramembrane serine protease [Flavobacteriales bacterium]
MASIQDEISKKWNSGGMVVRLIMVNLAVFLLIGTIKLLGVLGLPIPSSLDTGVYWLAISSDLGVLIRRPWSIVTHMFAHEGILHFFFNMLWLWFLGRMFQSMFGQRKLLATYLLGGFSGIILYLLMANLIPTMPIGGWAIGASAAVMAIFIGYATYFPNQQIRLPFIGGVAIKYIAIFYVIIDYMGLSGGNNVGGHVGHLGGALYGFILMTQIKKGTDIGLWFENFLDRLVNFVRGRKGGRMKVVYNKKGKNSKRRKTDEEFNADKNANAAKVDKILDKISKSGWDSLTKDEKDFLNAQK